MMSNPLPSIVASSSSSSIPQPTPTSSPSRPGSRRNSGRFHSHGGIAIFFSINTPQTLSHLGFSLPPSSPRLSPSKNRPKRKYVAYFPASPPSSPRSPTLTFTLSASEPSSTAPTSTSIPPAQAIERIKGVLIHYAASHRLEYLLPVINAAVLEVHSSDEAGAELCDTLESLKELHKLYRSSQPETQTSLHAGGCKVRKQVHQPSPILQKAA